MRHLFRHTVEVKRANATVFEAVLGLAEPREPQMKDSIIGNIANAKYTWTWGTEAIHEGDTVIFESVQYVIRGLKHDTKRRNIPYQVGYLCRVAGGR